MSRGSKDHCYRNTNSIVTDVNMLHIYNLDFDVFRLCEYTIQKLHVIRCN